MKAFRIDWTTKFTMVELGYRYALPRVECIECEPEWKNWGDGFFEFPAFGFDFLSVKEYTYKRVVSLKVFQEMKARIEEAVGRTVNLIPGCSIGGLAGISYKPKLDDFAWGRILYPQISKRARDLLANEGIELLTGECSIRYCGKPIHSHLSIQIEPVSLLTQESLQKLGVTRCPRCGHFKHPQPKLQIRKGPAPAGFEGYLIKRKAWPEGQHLVTMQETQKVLASPEFIEAVKRHRLRDIQFIECGRFV